MASMELPLTRDAARRGALPGARGLARTNKKRGGALIRALGAIACLAVLMVAATTLPPMVHSPVASAGASAGVKLAQRRVDAEVRDIRRRRAEASPPTALSSPPPLPPPPPAITGLYSLGEVTGIDGTSIDMAQFAGKVAVVVNLATYWGATAVHYQQLPRLYDDYKSRGLVVLGFPCNQFGAQEPGSDAEVAAYAREHGARFPIFSKSDVNGPGANVVYRYLTGPVAQGGDGGGDLQWNFEKFLVARDGHVIRRYGTSVAPDDLRDDIEAALLSPF